MCVYVCMYVCIYVCMHICNAQSFLILVFVFHLSCMLSCFLHSHLKIIRRCVYATARIARLWLCSSIQLKIARSRLVAFVHPSTTVLVHVRAIHPCRAKEGKRSSMFHSLAVQPQRQRSSLQLQPLLPVGLLDTHRSAQYSVQQQQTRQQVLRSSYVNLTTHQSTT